MSKHKMSDRWVSHFRVPSGGRVEIGDTLYPGLRLRVSGTGVKTWSAVIRVGDHVQRITIGRYPVVALADARAETLRLLRLAQQGQPLMPAGATASDAKALTLDKLIAAYCKHKSVGTRSWAMVERSLRRPEMQSLLKRQAAKITKRDIVGVVDSIAAAGIPHAAGNLLRHSKMLFNYAVERDLLPSNPLDKVRAPVRTTERDRVLSDSELGRVWLAAGDLPQPWAAMIRVLILTGQRRSEVSGMSWTEIDGDTWVLPRERVKKDRAHTVPLSPAALAVLRGLPGSTVAPGFVFSTDGGNTSSSNFAKIKAKLDASSGVAGYTLHDIRRTVRSGLAAMGIPEAVARSVVNHANGKIDRIYNRHQYLAEKREALERWSKHVVEVAARKNYSS